MQSMSGNEKYSTVQCSTILYSTMQSMSGNDKYSTVQYSAVQYYTIQYYAEYEW